MPNIKTIFSTAMPAEARIAALKEKTLVVPLWKHLAMDYEPKLHRIMTDEQSRKTKVRSDGTREQPARICVGLEKLLTKRVNEFTFAIPVRRVYSNTDGNATRSDIAKAMERIYSVARIDSENKKRGLAYYACCEIFSVWYAVRKDNTLYGFPAKYKLKCQTFSPMDGTDLYPLFDERGDLIAMSFEYTRLVRGQRTTFFETYTATKHYRWEGAMSDGGWREVTQEGGEDIEIMKIPGVYLWRPVPVYDGLSVIRNDIEYALSRNSDVIAYNSAPVLKIAGAVQGDEQKGETKRVYRVVNGGDVAYVSWQQSIEALKYHIETLLKLYFMQAQMPDISFENMKSLGNIGYDARMTLLMDAHLRIGDESGAWQEFLDREVNVVKAFLGKLRSDWASEIDNVEVENIITPFVQNDRKGLIETLTAGNGGKAVMSQLESIRELGQSDNPEETLRQIQGEEAAATAQSMASVFANGAAE